MNNCFNAPAKTPDSERGMTWYEHNILPTLSLPSSELDAISVGELDADERLMLVCLQGLVNREKPRLFLIPEHAGEGNEAWPDLLGLKLRKHPREKMWELLLKYRDCYSGVVLFSCDRSVHYVNLATTLSGIRDALPMTEPLYLQFKHAVGEIGVVEDLRSLTYNDAIGVYTYMYEHVWGQCTHRLIVSASPRNRHFIRDMAVCACAAVIWTENRDDAEVAVYKRFLSDMEPGNAAVTGWYTEERSGIGAAASFGLSTIPSDFYENCTVYAGTPHAIHKPKIPSLPALENKIYAAIYLSDGDNTQYNQHAMLNLWRNPDRGSIPINWTVSPVLADFGPGLLNYYYDTATDCDCFVSGPSGAGYSLIVDRHNRKVNLTDRGRAEKYVTLSDRYLEKSGIRSITVWDEATEMHADVYNDTCRSLYGATAVDWRMLPEPLKAIDRSRISIVPNDPGYTRDTDPIYKTFAEKIAGWDGSSPLFLSAQGISWNMTPANIKSLADRLDALAPGKLQIVRADHFFALYNKAANKPYNLCLEEGCAVFCSDSGALVDLGVEANVCRIRARGDYIKNDGIKNDGIKDDGIKVELSSDGVSYTEAFTVSDCDGGIDVEFDTVAARYVKLCGSFGDVEVFGNR